MTTDQSSSTNALTPEELAGESGVALPAKEVMSLLDLNANLDLALDAAAPIDLAAGANANIAAPIDAAVGANVLSAGSIADAGAQGGSPTIHQGIDGNATATSHQDSGITQSGSSGTSGTAGAGTSGAGTTPASTEPAGSSVSTPSTPSADSAGSLLDGNLLNVNVNLNGNLDLAAPINGAVAANANAAAPIDAGVSANVGSIDSTAVGVAHQDATIDQNITGDATATGDQTSNLQQ
jgi:hypothetical protein